MQNKTAQTADEYLAALPPDRREALAKVRGVLRKNLPKGFRESMEFGMIGYGVPLERFPETYNKRPLCLAGLASQKGYMTLYLMSVYGDPKLRAWFEGAFRKAGKKLDMGQSCVRFKSVEDLPLEVIGEAIGKVSVDELIAQHEAAHGKAAVAKRRATRRESR
jgi:hypothetical protein